MIREITNNDILSMDKQMRTNLINSLSGIRPANLIGTISKNGVTNLAIFNSVMHIGANPPLMGFIMRPTSVERHTYNNIIDSGEFTINHVTEAFYKKAHQTSARYDVSEFNATGLEPFYSNNLKAPYVAISPVKIGLSFIDDQLIKSNNTRLIIGEIEEIIIDDHSLNEDNILQLQHTLSIGVGGLETYYSLQKIDQLPYAKANQ